MTRPQAPLAGVRIADFTIHAAGPFCTHLLSQLGAECIKIESRTRPDAFRKPHAVYGRMQAATFDQVSANKLSVRLNLKQPEAVAIAKRIVALSDIAAESFRPGVMKRLGLDFEALREAKPDIVLLSLSSCGQSGPDSHFAGYAPLFGAWGGLGWMSGYSDGPPVEMRHVMDHSAGVHAAATPVRAPATARPIRGRCAPPGSASDRAGRCGRRRAAPSTGRRCRAAAACCRGWPAPARRRSSPRPPRARPGRRAARAPCGAAGARPPASRQPRACRRSGP